MQHFIKSLFEVFYQFHKPWVPRCICNSGRMIFNKIEVNVICDQKLSSNLQYGTSLQVTLMIPISVFVILLDIIKSLKIKWLIQVKEWLIQLYL